MQPAAIRDHFSSDEILLWFNEADTDCSGTLSPDEFFKWSLNNASQQHGADALAVAFNKYDRDGTGQLDAVEFGSACVELGFGVVANAIFKSLDHGAHRRHVTRPARHATHIVVLCVCVCVCVRVRSLLLVGRRLWRGFLPRAPPLPHHVRALRSRHEANALRARLLSQHEQGGEQGGPPGGDRHDRVVHRQGL